MIKLIVYNLKASFFHAVGNYFGSLHDSELANSCGPNYPKLSDEMTPWGFAILGDPAHFTKNTNGKVVVERKSYETAGIPTDSVITAMDVILQHVMQSKIHSTKWGVRALKAPFGILLLPLSASLRKRYTLLSACCRSLNLRTRKTGPIE